MGILLATLSHQPRMVNPVAHLIGVWTVLFAFKITTG